MLEELFERVSELERKINSPRVAEILAIETKSSEEITNGSERTIARNALIKKITLLYPGLFVSVAKRTDGGGLLLTRRADLSSYRVKFYYSKNYKTTEGRIFGWFSIRVEDLYTDKYDFYAMSLDFQDENHVFIFSYKQIMNLLEKKHALRVENINNNEDTDVEIEHFYIEQINHLFFETREINKNIIDYRVPAEGGIDVTYSYNNLAIFGEGIKGSKETKESILTINDRLIIRKKIDEILYSDFIVPLHKKDFSIGLVSEYIEINGENKDFQYDKEKIDKIKLIVVHCKVKESSSLDTLHNITLKMKKVFGEDIHMIFGVSRNHTALPQIQIIVVENKERRY